MSWKTDAACASLPPEWWSGETYQDRIAAQRVCWESCPVRGECLAAALARPEPVGIWGGYTTTQRDRIKRGDAPGPIEYMHARSPRRPATGPCVDCRRCERHVGADQVTDGLCRLCSANAKRQLDAAARIARFVELRDAGWSYADIAADIGVSERILYRYAAVLAEREAA